MNDEAQLYLERGRRYLAQASEEFARSDLEQASEKGWGAAAQSLKAIAAERGWKHGQHRQLYTITRRLADEEGSDELRGLFRYATDLHTNFYEGQMDPVEIEFSLGKVENLVRHIEDAIGNGR
ncbi:MAG: PaREP1 family protein [Chloroflexi bacterium]|nr:PaREP1 family protein [Chloroflexota bacterium]